MCLQRCLVIIGREYNDMSIKLMYITNDTQIASIAQKSGVDRIFVDLEQLGKEERQGHIDSVKSKHCLEDIKQLRPCITLSELLVRIDPINPNTQYQIEKSIEYGADIIMLPMWKSVSDVETFLSYVDGRVKTILLLETKEADECLEDVLKLKGIDEIHIGLNDLHLSYKKDFMFELITDGTVDRLCRVLRENNMPYGFGGVGRMGFGKVLAEHILCEHYRLNSSMVILSRSFCNSSDLNLEDIEKRFDLGVRTIRAYEKLFSEFDEEMYEENHKAISGEIEEVVKAMQERKND